MITGRPPLGCNRWLEAQIAADPGLVDNADPRTVSVGGEHKRAVNGLYQEWLQRVEAETGHPQVDPARGFRKAVENAVWRIRNGSNGHA